MWHTWKCVNPWKGTFPSDPLRGSQKKDNMQNSTPSPPFPRGQIQGAQSAMNTCSHPESRILVEGGNSSPHCLGYLLENIIDFHIGGPNFSFYNARSWVFSDPWTWSTYLQNELPSLSWGMLETITADKKRFNCSFSYFLYKKSELQFRLCRHFYSTCHAYN